MLRGHVVRRQRIQLLSDHNDEYLGRDDALTRVQSALRGHHARQRYLRDAAKQKSTNFHADESVVEEKVEKRRLLKQKSFLKKFQTVQHSSGKLTCD